MAVSCCVPHTMPLTVLFGSLAFRGVLAFGGDGPLVSVIVRWIQFILGTSSATNRPVFCCSACLLNIISLIFNIKNEEENEKMSQTCVSIGCMTLTSDRFISVCLSSERREYKFCQMSRQVCSLLLHISDVRAYF